MERRRGAARSRSTGTAAASSSWSATSIVAAVPTGATTGTVIVAVSSVASNGVSFAVTGSPPTVSITSPANGATVAGTTTISASATAAGSATIASVQFQVDGNNVGSAVTSSPYTYSWITTSYANGSHSIAAVATDSSSNTTVSATDQRHGGQSIIRRQWNSNNSGLARCDRANARSCLPTKQFGLRLRNVLRRGGSRLGRRGGGHTAEQAHVLGRRPHRLRR